MSVRPSGSSLTDRMYASRLCKKDQHACLACARHGRLSWVTYETFELTNGFTDRQRRASAVGTAAHVIGALLEIPDLHTAFAARVDVLVLIGDGHGADDITMNETAEYTRTTRTTGTFERIR